MVSDMPPIDPVNTIDLLRGHPSTRLLATTHILESAQTVLGCPEALPTDSYAPIRHPLHYGDEMGNGDVRAEIGRWVGEVYGLKEEEGVGAERILMTSGASFGLGEVLARCTSPQTGCTQRAFIVSPTYFLAARIFEDFGFTSKLTAIRSSGPTIDIPTLTSHLTTLSLTPPPPRPTNLPPTTHLYRSVLYCVPTYSNPTGTTWDLPTRRALVSLARQHNMLLISDDVYDFLGNDGDTSALAPDGKLLPRLVTIDRELMAEAGELEGGVGHAVSNCSFSKLLGPGLRCGWIETATGILAKQIGYGGESISGGNSAHFISTLIHPLIRSRAINSIITDLRAAYTSRSAAISTAVRQYLPAGTVIHGGRGGFFMWLELPAGYNAREIVKLALEGGVRVMKGDLTECPGVGNSMGWGDRCVRVSVSYCEAVEAVEGIMRLGAAVDKWRDDPEGSRTR